MLSVENISFSYGEFSIDGVKFLVEEGEILTLLGANGSGKTTILKCIYGLLKPHVGCVFIDGRDFHSLSLKERSKLIGYVPQMHTPPFSYTCLEVVVMGMAPRLKALERPGKEHYEKALEKLRILGMEDFKDRPYTELSGGQLQLILIARALVQEPKVLLLDEPTAHLDFKNQVMILEIVRKLSKNQGISAILTLHDPNLASLYSDKIAVVKDGKIVEYGESKNVLRKDLLEDIYSMPIRIIDLDGRKIIVPDSLF